MSWNGIQTFNNVKELLPHPTAFIFDSCAGYRSFPYDLDAPGIYHFEARVAWNRLSNRLQWYFMKCRSIANSKLKFNARLECEIFIQM